MFYKIGILKNLAKIVENTSTGSLFFNKVTTFLKRDYGTDVSLWILRNF